MLANRKQLNREFYLQQRKNLTANKTELKRCFGGLVPSQIVSRDNYLVEMTKKNATSFQLNRLIQFLYGRLRNMAIKKLHHHNHIECCA